MTTKGRNQSESASARSRTATFATSPITATRAAARSPRATPRSTHRVTSRRCRPRSRAAGTRILATANRSSRRGPRNGSTPIQPSDPPVEPATRRSSASTSPDLTRRRSARSRDSTSSASSTVGRRTRAPAAVEPSLQVLRAIMTAAYDNDLIGKNPCPEHQAAGFEQVRRPTADELAGAQKPSARLTPMIYTSAILALRFGGVARPPQAARLPLANGRRRRAARPRRQPRRPEI